MTSTSVCRLHEPPGAPYTLLVGRLFADQRKSKCSVFSLSHRVEKAVLEEIMKYRLGSVRDQETSVCSQVWECLRAREGYARVPAGKVRAASHRETRVALGDRGRRSAQTNLAEVSAETGRIGLRTRQPADLCHKPPSHPLVWPPGHSPSRAAPGGTGLCPSLRSSLSAASWSTCVRERSSADIPLLYKRRAVEGS